MAQYDLRIGDGRGDWIPLTLARDERGRPVFRSSTVRQVQPSLRTGEAGYANLNPETGGVDAQPDLSEGLGWKIRHPEGETGARGYYYAEWEDWSVPGQGQKGPAITTLTAPANSGTLRGSFVLGSVCYLLLSRIIAQWNGTGNDTLTQVRDLGASAVNSSGATFFQLGTAASVEASTTDDAPRTFDSADDRHAQQFRMSETGIRFLSKVTFSLARSATAVAGNVRCTLQTDRDNEPSGDVLATANVLGATLANPGPSTITFKFDTNPDDAPAIEPETPYWLVLDVAGAGTNTVTVRYATSNAYTRGLSGSSADGGNSWTTQAAEDLVFDVFVKPSTATVWVGADDGTNAFATSTNGSSYTADTHTRLSALVALVADRLVRDVRGAGCIVVSPDGKVWDEPIPIGDVTVACTALVPLGDILIVCKQDSLWAVDPSDATVQQLTPAVAPVSTNGVGASEWKGTVYVPFDGKLTAVSGNFDSGFTVHISIGPEALPEWDSPWGAGRIVAVAGDRFHLYAAMSATGGYRLLKSADPTSKKWHGSLATLGDGTQTIQKLEVYDAGGTSNPELFFTTTSNNVGRIRLPRNANPASDSSYRYDVSTVGDLYRSRITGNFHVNDKAWFSESLTFTTYRAGDYVDVLYDTIEDRLGWRRLGRLYDTGSLAYEEGLASKLLATRYRIGNSLNTASPLLMAPGTSFAVLSGGVQRRFTFTVEVDDHLSAVELGDLLGLSAEVQEETLFQASASGTRSLEYHGRVFGRVRVQSVEDVDVGAGRRQIAIVAEQVR